MDHKSRYMKSLFFVIVFLGAMFFLCCKKEDAPDQNRMTVNVGGLLSLTGSWSNLGLASREAMNLAIRDVNNQMEITGSRYRFTAIIYDTKLDTTLAKNAIGEALRNNTQYIIGPQSSAELQAIQSIVNANQILVVSQGSTASNLAISGDAIFRFCPGDSIEGSAMAQTIFDSGRRALITLARGGAGNIGLQQVVGTVFSNLGGTVDAMTPYNFNTTDFSSVLASLKTKIQQHSSQLGASKVGVYLASFDEAKDLFHQAAADPVFSSVQWYGGDGVTSSPVLISDATAASFAAAAHFFAPSFGLPQQSHPQLASISAAIKSKTGQEPDAYALAAYDAVWVIARTAASFPEPTKDFQKLKQVFQSTANQYYGITGPLLLNAAGDRSMGTFDYWGVVAENGGYAWKLVGKSR
jgi:branched-chain amino acid transport system substrate-binding protein